MNLSYFERNSYYRYISLVDVTQAAQMIEQELLMCSSSIAALFYLVIVIVLSKLMKMLERRLATVIDVKILLNALAII